MTIKVINKETRKRFLKQGYAKKNISFGSYPIKVQLVVAIDLDKANAFFKKQYYKNGDAYHEVRSRTGLCRVTEWSEVAILIPCNANTEVVTHECAHAVCFLLDSLGVKYGDPKNTELLCYPLGYLCRAVFNELHNWRTK